MEARYTRYTFRDDNDGHSYLLPVDKIKAFELWLEDTDSEDFDCERFSEFYINGLIEQVSFERPRRDQ